MPPPGHLRRILNRTCSNWVTLKPTLHSPLYRSLPQFYRFGCSGQKPWCHHRFFFLSFLSPNLLANVISSTFKTYFYQSIFPYLHCFYAHPNHHHLLPKLSLWPLPLSSLTSPWAWDDKIPWFVCSTPSTGSPSHSTKPHKPAPFLFSPHLVLFSLLLQF